MREIIDHAQQHCLLHSCRHLFSSAPYNLVPRTFPMTTPHGHQWWCCVVSLHNQGSTVLIPNVVRTYFTVFSSLFLSLLLTHRQLILSVRQAWSCGWSFRHQLCCSTYLHGLQNLAHLNNLVHHPNLGLVGEYHWGRTHLWVLHHAASHRKVSLSCVGKCSSFV